MSWADHFGSQYMGKHIGNPLRIWKNILGRFGHFSGMFSQKKHRFLQILSKFINNSPVVGVGSFPSKTPPNWPETAINWPISGGFLAFPKWTGNPGKHENGHFLSLSGHFSRHNSPESVENGWLSRMNKLTDLQDGFAKAPNILETAKSSLPGSPRRVKF